MIPTCAWSERVFQILVIRVDQDFCIRELQCKFDQSIKENEPINTN